MNRKGGKHPKDVEILHKCLTDPCVFSPQVHWDSIVIVAMRADDLMSPIKEQKVSGCMVH